MGVKWNQMSLHTKYQDRIQSFRTKASLLQQKESRLSVARLGVFLLTLLLFYFAFGISVALAIVLAVTGLSVLAWLIKYHGKVNRERQFFMHLVKINELELLVLDGKFHEFPDGSKYIDREHANSYDLDLFGRASLFQFINRTSSEPASNLLAKWLKDPAGVEEIRLRQEAITELASRLDWRQNLIAVGYEYEEAANNPRELLSWLKEGNIFLEKKYLKPLTYGLSTISLIVAGLTFFFLPTSALVLVLTLNFWLNYRYIKSINKVHQQVSRSFELLQSYTRLIHLIEEEKFSSAKLKAIQQWFKGEVSASKEIKLLSRLVNRLDTRLNVMVSVPLNLFFFWDIHYCLGLERWKSRNKACMEKWFETMAEFEVLASFATMAFNNPAWCMPVIQPEYFRIKAEEAGHPLIPPAQRVCNTFEIDGAGKIMLITGSNMSGKSTFLRTCGINMVLAMAGAPVCAKSFEVSHARIFSSMRISDSLEDNTSSFYAELKRLAAIIKQAEKDSNIFLLLDEILRGTNSNDRYIGSVALIKQLISYKTTGILATHDLKLSELQAELPRHIDNYHFDVKINGEELYFDYTISPGICQSLNASLLMKKMGIKI